MSDVVSYTPLVNAVGDLLDSVSTGPLNKRAERARKNLSFQINALESVPDFSRLGFRRTDWSIGHQATIVIPLQVKMLCQNSAAHEAFALRCTAIANELAVELNDLAEGR